MKRNITALLYALLISIGAAQAQSVVYDANAQVRKVESFHGVDVGGGIALYLTQGKEQAVAISAEDTKNIEKIKTVVKDGILKIYVDRGAWNNWNWGNRKLKAYVTVTELTYLGVSGGSVAKLVDGISVNNLTADASGGSIIEGKLTGTSLNADLSGGSITKLTGNFSSATIEASGGSIFKDYELTLSTCSVDASGGSIINVTINKELKAEASGGSIIHYKGTGVITSVEASGGSIIKKKDI